MTLTPQTLAALEAVAKAATPGPWRNGTDLSHYNAPEVTDDKTFAYYVPKDADARFIAACSPDVVLALLARARRADEIERLAARYIVALDDYDGNRYTKDGRAALNAAEYDLRTAINEESRRTTRALASTEVTNG